MPFSEPRDAWPDLDLPALSASLETLQLWTQMVGKLRLAQTPWLNHSWHVTLRVSARGLRTPLIPCDAGGFDIEFDLSAGALVVRSSDGEERQVRLAAQSVADFHAAFVQALAALGLPSRFDGAPNELTDAVAFAEDRAPRVYDGAAVKAYWRALVQADRVLNRFRTGFIGKCSPVHLFWGGLDLAVTRFSGRRAPLHPGGVPHLPDTVTREAYSHEVSSAGFWPGGPGMPEPAFYSYAYPTPAGFGQAVVSPPEARWSPELGEFLLPYGKVRAAADPDAVLMDFLRSTYAAAADLGAWDREALEVAEGRPGKVRPL